NLYNLAERGSEDVLRHCEANGLGFIPWYPIASGELAGRQGPLQEVADALGATAAQVALAWLLRRSPVVLPIPGTSTVAHLEENCAAATLDLDDSQMAALDTLASSR
ncbi:MAG TPA: aldo/keto reductase, partial [Acidimicrobiales bacterium]|nr:aldo/keto reductase [Acidimicrobiales bacterium]